MTLETLPAKHKHCPECGSDYDGSRSRCTDCILKESDEIEEGARGLHDAEPAKGEDHEIEHAAEDEEGFDHEAEGPSK